MTADNVEIDVPAPDQSNYVPPKPGMYRAVLVDVIDLGMVKSFYKGKETEKHKIKLVWELDAKKPGSDFPYTVSRRISLPRNPFHENAGMRALFDEWGIPIPPVGTKYNFGGLCGRPALIVVTNEPAKDGSGKVFPNIKAVMADDSDNPYLPSGSYKRHEARHEDDDPVPF